MAHASTSAGSLKRALLRNRGVRLGYKVVRYPERAILRVLFQAKQMRTTLEHERSRLNAWLAEQFGRDGLALHEEYVGSDFARWYQHRKRELEQWPTMYRLGTTGDFGCEVAYLLVRAAKPRVVVDTGVLYGASSAHILAALARNGTGELHSIDLGVAADEPPHDFFVPHDLKARWRLIIGDSRRVLPALLMRLGRVDLFHHDSLHTFEHMTWEYRTALPYLANGGVLSSDDVRIVHSLREVFRTNAFPAFCAAHGLRFGLFYNAGIALCGESSPARLSDADS